MMHNVLSDKYVGSVMYNSCRLTAENQKRFDRQTSDKSNLLVINIDPLSQVHLIVLYNHLPFYVKKICIERLSYHHK